jgi:hypothetical protein
MVEQAQSAGYIVTPDSVFTQDSVGLLSGINNSMLGADTLEKRDKLKFMIKVN